MNRYRVDGLEPREVILPADASEVGAALAEAHRNGSSVIPWGGGTRMHVGNLPTSFDFALDLTQLNASIDHVAGDMTVICDAGVRVADLTDLLKQENQRLPFEVLSPAHATIGGSVASNAPSRLRPRFGGIRDWIIGIAVVSADGTQTKSGGRVVKNVQGYDLHRLHTGAFGTLGVVTSVALKLVPMPERTQTIAVWFDQIEAARSACREVGMSKLTIEAARIYSGPRAVGATREFAAQRHMDGDVDLNNLVLMLVQVSGSASALKRQVDELTGLAGTIPATGYETLRESEESEIWDFMETHDSNPVLSFQIAAKPTDTFDAVHRIIDRYHDARVSSAIDVGHGSATLNVDGSTVDQIPAVVAHVINIVRNAGGSVLIERCPPEIKSNNDVFGVDPASERIMKGLKREFDGSKVLNPGRFAFGI